MTHPPTAADQTPDTTITLAEPGRFSGHVQRTVLPGGLRVITENTPSDPTSTFSIVVANGSRDEPEHLTGVTHFLEHLLFKGTRTRTWQQVTAELDAVGAVHNAYTTHEHTGYWATSLSADLKVTIDVIADLVANSTLPEQEIETERQVILEEIAMRHDHLPVHVYDEAYRALFGDHTPMGRSSGGNEQSLARATRGELHAYYQQHYTPPNLIVTAAGGVEHDLVVDQVRTIFADHLFAEGSAHPSQPRPAHPGVQVHSTTQALNRASEQTVIGIGMEGLSQTDPRRAAADVLTAMIADAPSSRLYQEVREKRGLAYSVQAKHESFADTGLWLLRVGCSPTNAPEVVRICRDELATVAAHGLTTEEFIRARGYVAGQKGIAVSSSLGRAQALSGQELYSSVYSSQDMEQDRVGAVTEQDVCEIAAELLGRPQSLVVLGPEGKPGQVWE